MAKVETRSGSEITITYGGDEVVKVDYPFGLDDWRHRATVMCSYENSPADSDQLPPLSGLEVTELRTTAPTTMRRWDQHFGRSSELQNTVEWTPSQSAEPGIWATLTNGTRVYGDKEWVDKMVAYYGKKAEPPQVRVEAQNRAPQFKMTRGPTDDEVRIFLVGETPAEADPMAILAAEYAKACEAETAVDWQDMRFVDGNAYGAQIAVHTPKRAQGTVLWTSEKREPEPKRSPSAKPALTSLSIEAPLGNRYGGLGWCDED